MQCPYNELRLGQREAAEAWLRSGGETNAPFAAEDWNPLQLACAEGNVGLVRLLLDLGARPDARVSGKTGPLQTALHIAARCGQRDVAQSLVAAGASIDIADARGFRPLHYAAVHGHLDCIRVLHDAGASALSTSDGGATPADMAQAAGHADAAALLARAMPKERARAAVKAWLEALDCEEYSRGFMRAGYDDLAFIAEHGINSDDLDCIGVPMNRLGVRRKLMALHNIALFVEALRVGEDGREKEGGSSAGNSEEGSNDGSGSEGSGTSDSEDDDSGSGSGSRRGSGTGSGSDDDSGGGSGSDGSSDNG